MSGFGAFIASSGLRWNRRCAFHPRTRSAIRCRVCQSLSFHQSSRMSAAGIVAYPQCRSLVGDFVQCTHISASSGSSSIPSGGHIASFTFSPSFDMRGINVRSPILHCFPLSFSHSYARIMQLWPKILTSNPSPSPSLVSMANLGLRPHPSSIGGVAFGTVVTMYVFIQDASGLRRIVLANAMADPISEMIAIISLSPICICSSFLRHPRRLMNVAIESLRRRKGFDHSTMRKGNEGVTK